MADLVDPQELEMEKLLKKDGSFQEGKILGRSNRFTKARFKFGRKSHVSGLGVISAE